VRIPVNNIKTKYHEYHRKIFVPATLLAGILLFCLAFQLRHSLTGMNG
jgi:hypothetical protein